MDYIFLQYTFILLEDKLVNLAHFLNLNMFSFLFVASHYSDSVLWKVSSLAMASWQFQFRVFCLCFDLTLDYDSGLK